MAAYHGRRHHQRRYFDPVGMYAEAWELEFSDQVADRCVSVFGRAVCVCDQDDDSQTTTVFR